MLRFFIFFLTFYFSFYGQNKQSGEIEYHVTYNSFPKEMLLKMNRTTRAILENASPVTGIISFSGNEAIYRLKKEVFNEGNEGINITRIVAGNNDLYYFNKDILLTLRQTSTTGKIFLVEYPKLKWEVLNETKKIGKYKCLKAVLINSEDSNTIAWFTPDIPFSFGPLYYNGLPGLIMELNTSMGTFRVSSLDYEKASVILNIPTKGEKVTKEEYQTILKKKAPIFF